MKMKTVRVAARIDERLFKALEKRGNNLGATIRALLASGIGKPELAAVNPEGRPRTRERKE